VCVYACVWEGLSEACTVEWAEGFGVGGCDGWVGEGGDMEEKLWECMRERELMTGGRWLVGGWVVFG
jgi:hypothetical protein